jgi:hypothetical protein
MCWGVQKHGLIPTLTQVLPKLEAKVPQNFLVPLVERLLEVTPGRALLMQLVTLVTSAMRLVGAACMGGGVIGTESFWPAVRTAWQDLADNGADRTMRPI